MKDFQYIIDQLPYRRPFLFVDELSQLDDEGVEGYYRFREDEYFYHGHFVGQPVTPGVILTECMAQIGLVCLGIYLVQRLKLKGQSSVLKPERLGIAFSESQVVFEKAVFPGEKVKVFSRKKYWRLGKLKCAVEMFNESGERVCYGTLSGLIG